MKSLLEREMGGVKTQKINRSHKKNQHFVQEIKDQKIQGRTGDFQEKELLELRSSSVKIKFIYVIKCY